jgi:hypothetical protein
VFFVFHLLDFLRWFPAHLTVLQRHCLGPKPARRRPQKQRNASLSAHLPFKHRWPRASGCWSTFFLRSLPSSPVFPFKGGHEHSESSSDFSSTRARSKHGSRKVWRDKSHECHVLSTERRLLCLFFPAVNQAKSDATHSHSSATYNGCST